MARAAGVTIAVSDDARRYITERRLLVTLHASKPRLEYALFYLVKNCSDHALTYRRDGERRFAILLEVDPNTVPPSPGGAAAALLASFKKGLPKTDTLPDDLLKDHLKQLAPLGRAATPALSHELMHSRDWRTRYLAVRALRRLVDPKAIEALIHAIGDGFYGGISFEGMGVVHEAGRKIREEALDALKEIGKPAHEALLATARRRGHRDQLAAVQGLSTLEVPGGVGALIGLARDRWLDEKVRLAAVKALTKKNEGAQRALVSLLQDEKVRAEAVKALRHSEDKTAIVPLMGYVRAAARDYDLAREAAHIIAFIDREWLPKAPADAVDFLLHFSRLENIEDRLGTAALHRLRFWVASDCEEMRERADRALAHFKRQD
ncbi:MAG: HEAT repeat domain-containing protein [Planctomycetota bacterium]